MSDLIPFESAKLPAYMKQFAGLVSADDLTSGVGVGFPVVSIKGKVFHLVRGDEKTLITKPGEDEPAASLEVVILKANPHLSKIYYSEGYVEGSSEKPTCYSNDGVAPASDAQEPQAKKCATCPHNQWGAKITEQGKKGKTCADSRRLAVAPVGQLNDPMLIRVPAASLKALQQYGDALKKRGVAYPMVQTKIGFDYSVAHPALTFKPTGFLPEGVVAQVAEMLESDLVQQIVGAVAFAGGDPAEDAPAAPKAAAPKPQAPAPEPEPEAEPAPPVAETKPAKAAPKAAKPKVDTAGLDQQLDALLASSGFDD